MMKPLSLLMDGVPIRHVRGDGEVSVTAVVDDSRQVVPGALFVARPGTDTDGSRFIGDAIAAGAVAVLAPGQASGHDQHRAQADVTWLEVEPGADPAVCGAILTERLHDDPSRRLDVIGITGTNGKTTTVHLVQQLLTASGISCGLIGTVCVHDGIEARPAQLTTPGAFELSPLLQRMVFAGCKACVMEASSHALAQRRLAGLKIAGAVFTNLSGDHLDYHGTMEAYLEAKLQLVDQIGTDGWLVTNVDNDAGREAARRCRGEVLSCTVGDQQAACRATVRDAGRQSTAVDLHGPWGTLHVELPLVGLHNVANALQATAVAYRMGVAETALGQALGRCHAPPGRLEPVTDADAPFTVLVDYAHTDDALANVLGAVRPLVPSGNALRVVFGCGGDRDRSKRPRMASVAWKFADEVIVTSDNPRTEDPDAIIAEVLTGVPSSRRAATLQLPDRREAIETAVGRCRRGDVVVIAGKGHEDYQIIGTQRRPFDDRVVARNACSHTGGAT